MLIQKDLAAERALAPAALVRPGARLILHPTYLDQEMHDQITRSTERLSAMQHWARKSVGPAFALAELELRHHERPAPRGFLRLASRLLLF